MSQRRSILAAFFAVALQVAASPATGATPVKEVQVMGPRVHLIDVVPTAPAAFATARSPAAYWSQGRPAATASHSGSM